MSKGGGQQTVTSTPDAATQQYVDRMRRLALGYAGIGGETAPMGPPRTGNRYLDRMIARDNPATPGTGGEAITQELPPEVQNALAQYGRYSTAGNLGLSALTGDAGAISQFMNPYSSTLDPYWDQIRKQSLGTINDAATQARAFGGSRQGVATGQALADVANAQAGQRYGEFTNAMGRAGQLANLGFSATGLGAFLPQQWQAGQIGLLNSAIGPYGTTQSVPTQGGGLEKFLGTGLSLASFIPGPWQAPAALTSGAAATPGFFPGGYN